MALDVDWTGVDANPYRIFVPRADMPVVQVSPEIRSLDLDAFRHELKDLEATGTEGIMWTDTHAHSGETVLSGVTYARFVKVIAPYTVEFEDGQYRVLTFGANHNVADVQIANQVGIIVQNSAGLTVPLTQEDVAQAVWDALLTNHVIDGSAGRILRLMWSFVQLFRR